MCLLLTRLYCTLKNLERLISHYIFSPQWKREKKKRKHNGNLQPSILPSFFIHTILKMTPKQQSRTEKMLRFVAAGICVISAYFFLRKAIHNGEKNSGIIPLEACSITAIETLCTRYLGILIIRQKEYHLLISCYLNSHTLHIFHRLIGSWMCTWQNVLQIKE